MASTPSPAAAATTPERGSLLRAMRAYRREASWAVWWTDEAGELTGEMAFPVEDAEPLLHGRAMIVSLNPATGGVGEDDPDVPDWSNFHSSKRKHNDRFLAVALHGTPLWGAYMTDLHPALHESDSRLVRPTAEVVALSVESLIAQAKLLGEVRTIVCVGGKTHDAVAAHASEIERAIGVPASEVRRITHYSGAASRWHGGDALRYRDLVHGALGLG